MHSLHIIKKRDHDAQVAGRLRLKSDVINPDAHQAKTRTLAGSYESRVDGWLVQTSESKIEPIPKIRLACHHCFRERSADLELANPRVSPLNYVPERDRIEKELSMGNSSLVMRDRWTQKSGSLFREREPGKEIQPAMVYKHRTEPERINAHIAKNPVMPLQTWCHFDHPVYRKFRGGVDPLKFKGGYDFDLYKSRGFGTNSRSPPAKNFLFSELPYVRAFASPTHSNVDDFRPHDSAHDLEGKFYNVAPGYSPDSLPGKWRMDHQITVPAEPPKLWRTYSPPSRTVSAENLAHVKSPLASNKSLCTTSRSLPRCEVPYPMPKTYWKATTQAANSNPIATQRYDREVQHKAFSDHHERATNAKKLVVQHLGVKELDTHSSKHSSFPSSPFPLLHP